MSTVGNVCNREVVVVERDATVVEAAQLMRDYHVGDLVVAEERNGRRFPLGILTDRDLVVEVLAKQVALESVAVRDIMSPELVTARESDDLLDTLRLMRERGVRRLPVVGNDQSLVGIITVDDLLDLLAEELGELSRLISREQTRERQQRN